MNTEQLYIYVIVAIVAIILYYVFLQAAHQIAKRNRYMEAQINLLSKIAEKQGVDKAEINEIVNRADNKKVDTKPQ